MRTLYISDELIEYRINYTVTKGNTLVVTEAVRLAGYYLSNKELGRILLKHLEQLGSTDSAPLKGIDKIGRFIFLCDIGKAFEYPHQISCEE